MDFLTSRKNRIVTHLKNLTLDGVYRREIGEYVCDGEKLLKEALKYNAKVSSVLWGGDPAFALPENIPQYCTSKEIMQSVSPLKNSPGPVFSVTMPKIVLAQNERITSAIVLENVQDPGNVGTVIRTADALGTDAVILVGTCADLYAPKTVRATMGGIFRQCVLEMNLEELKAFVRQNELSLYGAALSEEAIAIQDIELNKIAVAVGSEGRGLTTELLSICDGQLIIPMEPDCESLNAAVAASIIMWEMYR